MKRLIYILCCCLIPIYSFCQKSDRQANYAVGYSLDIKKIDLEKLRIDKQAGMDYIEIAGLGSFVNADLTLKITETDWIRKCDSLALILKNAQIKVWSVHMPFSSKIDISTLDEETRKQVIRMHLQLLQGLRRLDPQVILFHPSYYLEPNKRSERKDQLVRSVQELYTKVSKAGLQLVIENMLGPALMVGERERPLLRTVEECQELFARFPKMVGIAVDMNHIAHPEKLLLAFGTRVKTLHVADGDGTKESHYLPCNGKGQNDWNKILATLEKIQYKGVFMFECHYETTEQLMACYRQLQQNYNIQKN
ncbi:sugar phosphate isomerase/epimerase [Sphingobacterium sp. N143]|uniref:sugar phosphate isomerase/epimerase family protein n=1 Tax=Sphingobacterium sp. N143 TaxID=2746727 RepID=UPI0025756DE3|nr:TIM barrel protein [Sphingobacterium sp. N143]MDM1295658.1 sugar phosphate isomerase/epimerase [Sphingobacterium sp. N143]